MRLELGVAVVIAVRKSWDLGGAVIFVIRQNCREKKKKKN